MCKLAGPDGMVHLDRNKSNNNKFWIRWGSFNAAINQ